MSGIFGYMQTSAEEVKCKCDLTRIQCWNRAYGRDGEAVWETDGFGFGCVLERLSVNAAKGSSPVLKKNKKYAVIDALLYNREELVERCGAKSTTSDEELLFFYVEKEGPEALKDVNGDFAGAIYDTEKRTLTLFRDHMGVRPLYYYADDRNMVFSSDIRGVVAVQQTDAALNEDWLYKMMAGYWTDGLTTTEFRHVFCVEPGSVLRFSVVNDKLVSEKKKYWSVGQKKVRLSSEQEYIEKLRELITDAVKRRLDVIPGVVGGELSGGLDSGVIDILINRMGREGVYYSWANSPEQTEYVKDDERLVIEDICKQENITCHYSMLNEGVNMSSEMAEGMRLAYPELNSEELPALRYALPPYINALTLCGAGQCARQNGARVIFSGHGGDEGVSHRCSSYELFYHREYVHFLRQIWAITAGQKPRVWRFIKKCGKILLRVRKELKEEAVSYFCAPEMLTDSFKQRLGKKKMASLPFAYDPKSYIEAGGIRNRLDNASLLGAYCGVRYVFPYVDYRVMEYALSIPRHLYLRGSQNRYIFREAFRDMIPESLYIRRCKDELSKKGGKQDPEWYKVFEQKRQDTVNRLDKEYWKGYLNFEAIEEWVQSGKPSDEERFHAECVVYNLFLCALVGNIVKKTREPE